MRYPHLVLPFAGAVLIFFQTSVLNVFSAGWFNVEISLVLVIYAGFRMNVVHGALLSFLLGFFLDCAMGSISGLYTLIYVCIFFASVLVSMRVYAEQTSLIIGYVFLCSITEGLMVVFFFMIVYNINMLDNMARVFLPQALLISALSPLFFKLFKYFEVSLHDANQQAT